MREPRDNMVSFQMGLSLPIFAGRKQGAMARSMSLMRESTLSEAEQLWRDVSARLSVLASQADLLRRSLDFYRERIIPATEDAYRSALAGYISNRTSFINLLTYGVALYRDQITANALANQLARTYAEVERFTTDPRQWSDIQSGSAEK